MDRRNSLLFAAVFALASGFGPARAQAEDEQRTTSNDGSGNDPIKTHEANIVNNVGWGVEGAGKLAEGYLPKSWTDNMQGWGKGTQDTAAGMWDSANDPANMVTGADGRQVYDQSKISAEYPGMTVSNLDTTSLNLTGNGLSPYNFSPQVREAIERGGRIVTDDEGNVVTVAVPGQSLRLTEADAAGLRAAMDGARVQEGQEMTLDGMQGRVQNGEFVASNGSRYPIDEFGQRQPGPPTPPGLGGNNSFNAFADIGNPGSNEGIVDANGNINEDAIEDDDAADQNTLLVQGCTGSACAGAGAADGGASVPPTAEVPGQTGGDAGGAVALDPNSAKDQGILASIRDTNRTLREGPPIDLNAPGPDFSAINAMKLVFRGDFGAARGVLGQLFSIRNATQGQAADGDSATGTGFRARDGEALAVSEGFYGNPAGRAEQPILDQTNFFCTSEGASCQPT